MREIQKNFGHSVFEMLRNCELTLDQQRAIEKEKSLTLNAIMSRKRSANDNLHIALEGVTERECKTLVVTGESARYAFQGTLTYMPSQFGSNAFRDSLADLYKARDEWLKQFS